MRLRCAFFVTAVLVASAGQAASVQQCVAQATAKINDASALRRMGFDDRQVKFLQAYRDVIRSGLAIEVQMRQTISDIELLMSYSTPKEQAALAKVRKVFKDHADNVHSTLIDLAYDRNTALERGCESLTQRTAEPPVHPPQPPQPRPRSPGTFYRDDSLTTVTNTHSGELAINAAGQTAHFDNRRHSSGATWQIDYTWHVPEALITGQKGEVSIGEEILGVQPRQEISDSINILAPDLAKQVIARYPTTASASETYELPLSEGYRDVDELKITVGFVSSTVTYVYRRQH